MKKTNNFMLKAQWLGYQLKDNLANPVSKPDINGIFSFGTEIWIDGQRMESEHAIDFFDLLRSVHEPIERYRSNIFTCGCGVSSCAGIIDGVSVTHHGRYVFWTFRTPLKGGWGKHAEADWVRESNPKRLRFLRSQLLSQCVVFLRTILEVNSFDLTRCTVMTNSAPLSEVLTWIRFNWKEELAREAAKLNGPGQKPKIEMITYEPPKVNSLDEDLDEYVETNGEVLK